MTTAANLLAILAFLSALYTLLDALCTIVERQARMPTYCNTLPAPEHPL